MKELPGDFTRVVAFLPTGWAYQIEKATQDLSKAAATQSPKGDGGVGGGNVGGVGDGDGGVDGAPNGVDGSAATSNSNGSGMSGKGTLLPDAAIDGAAADEAHNHLHAGRQPLHHAVQEVPHSVEINHKTSVYRCSLCIRRPSMLKESAPQRTSTFVPNFPCITSDMTVKFFLSVRLT
jgi:hypothetical protein